LVRIRRRLSRSRLRWSSLRKRSLPLLSRSRRLGLMASISVDTSEVRAAVADMSGVDARLRPDVASVVKKGATNIKSDLTAQMRSSRHFKGFADIGYDMIDSFEAEIGPNKGGPGSGANIAYFG